MAIGIILAALIIQLVAIGVAVSLKRGGTQGSALDSYDLMDEDMSAGAAHGGVLGDYDAPGDAGILTEEHHWGYGPSDSAWDR